MPSIVCQGRYCSDHIQTLDSLFFDSGSLESQAEVAFVPSRDPFNYSYQKDLTSTSFSEHQPTISDK